MYLLKDIMRYWVLEDEVQPEMFCFWLSPAQTEVRGH